MQYHVLQKSFINNRIVEPGDIVECPEGWTGDNLVPVGVEEKPGPTGKKTKPTEDDLV